MRMLIALEGEVTDEKTITDSVETLVSGIADQVKKAGTDPAKVSGLASELHASAPAMAKAVVANTPATVTAVAAAWKPQQVYAAGAYVQPVPPNGHTYACTVAGTSGATQPAFPTADKATVADGSVTWTEQTAKTA
jgi:hypothetical protein